MSIPPRDFREFPKRTGLIISAQFYRSEVDKEEMTAGGDEDDFCAKQIRRQQSTCSRGLLLLLLFSTISLLFVLLLLFWISNSKHTYLILIKRREGKTLSQNKRKQNPRGKECADGNKTCFLRFTTTQQTARGETIGCDKNLFVVQNLCHLYRAAPKIIKTNSEIQLYVSYVGPNQQHFPLRWSLDTIVQKYLRAVF